MVVLATISAVQIYSLRRTLGEPVSVPVALGFGVASWLGWGIAMPAILALGRRFDFRRGRRLLSVIVHLPTLVVVHLAATFLLIVVGIRLFNPEEAFPWNEAVQQVFASTRFQFGVVLYLAILGLGRGLVTWEALRQREAQAARLEAQASRARLEVLAARLQPHFLFNALHAIGVLIEESPARARAMLVELGELLREVLAEPTAIEIPLGDELRLLQRYLAIEEIRFADRLRVEMDVPDALRGVPVPRLLLQPLVENAMRHGIGQSASGGTVRIAAASDEESLVITVANDGAALATSWREGVGLTTTRERLSARHGDRASLDVVDLDGWVEARVRLPRPPA